MMALSVTTIEANGLYCLMEGSSARTRTEWNYHSVIVPASSSLLTTLMQQ